MGKISKDINENQLENTQEANDKIVAYMDKLEIVKYMRHNINENYTSSDDQKFSLAPSIDSTNASFFIHEL